MDYTILITDYFIPIAAIVGLFLSIYNTYRQYRQFRPNLLLDFYYLDEYYEPSLSSEIPFDGYILRIKNLGNVNVIVDYVGCKWKDKQYIRRYYGELFREEFTNFPCKIEPGSKFIVEFSRQEIQNELIKTGATGHVDVKAYVKDGTGKYYTSPPLLLMIDQRK